jgi:HlyD family secretion protein
MLCTIAAGLISCGSLGNQADKTVQLVKVTRGNLTTTVNGSGNLEAVKSRILAFGTSGQIKTIAVKEGQIINKGDILASLIDNAFVLNVTQAEVAYTQAEVGVTQAQVTVQSAELNVKQAEEQHRIYSSNLNKDQLALARAQVEAAKQSLGLAEKSLQLAEQSLDETRRQLDESILKAPFDGIVAKLYVKEGEMVTPAVSAAVILDPSAMQFEIQVDEIDVVEVMPGQKVKIALDAIPDLELEGKVDFISDLPSAQTGVIVYDTRITFDVPAGRDFKVGMSASADIVTAVRENILLVPDRALGKNEAGEMVVTVRADGKDQVKVVTTGISDGLQTEIVSGLQEDEMVVVERSSQSIGGFF